MSVCKRYSEESSGVDCLGIMLGEVKLFDPLRKDTSGGRLKVPHMGWNNVQQSIEHLLWHGIDKHSQFYFVRSYYATAESNPNVAAYCDYGVTFDVALSHNNLFALQFHPEKSAEAGLQLLRNFTRWMV